MVTRNSLSKNNFSQFNSLKQFEVFFSIFSTVSFLFITFLFSPSEAANSSSSSFSSSSSSISSSSAASSVSSASKKSSKVKSKKKNKKDLETITRARELFEKGDFKQAIQAYNKIDQDSDFWLETLEEKAWTWVRLENYEKALAELQSITATVWAPQVGPESYMLSAFVSLKICAYKDVLEKIKLFKERMIPRAEALQSLVSATPKKDFSEYYEKMKSQKISLIEVGEKAQYFPRFFYRDNNLISASRNSDFQSFSSRMKELAEIDLEEIETNLKKMKLIEVQVIQQVMTADELKSSNKKLSFNKIDKNNALTFPVSDSNDEVWLDEMGHFEVKTNKCPFNKKGGN